MHKYLIPTAILCLSLCMSAYRFLPTDNSFPFAKDSLMSPLALYGQYIYQRENCATCHTTLEKKKALLHNITLEGVGGKYSNDWHYYHFSAPRSISPSSQMPAFTALFEKEINEATLYKWIKKARKDGFAYPVGYEKTAYTQMKQQAKEMQANLAENKITAEGIEKKEIIALIAYIQQIPISPEKRTRDSIRLRIEEENWNKQIIDNEKGIMTYALSTNKDTIALGKELFKVKCAVCHGLNGEGMIGPNLTDEYWLHGAKTDDIIHSIKYGIPEKGMMAWRQQLSPSQVGLLTAYIHSLKGTNPENPKEAQGEKE